MGDRRLLAAGVLALALVPLAPRAARADKTWDSPAHNVQLDLPDRWEWDADDPAFRKYHIVRSARWTLERLRGGKPAQGEGALLQLAVRDLAEAQDPATLAADPKVREFLTQRMTSHGEIEGEETAIGVLNDEEARHPGWVLRTQGEASNLKGTKAACTGVLVVTRAKGKLYLLRMYAWPASEYDDEGVKVELDFLEGRALTLLDVKEEGAAAPKPPDGGEGEGAEERPEEDLKEEVFDNLAQGWRLVKHKKLRSVPVEDGEEDLVLKFEDADSHGGYQVLFYAILNGKIVDGVQQAPPDLRKWMTTDWWKYFHIQHEKGEIATWKWPRRTARKTFVTFPDFADEDGKVVIFEADEKREIDPKPSDMEKWKAVEKPRVDNIGPRGKASEAMRGILIGNRGGPIGVETVLRYAWRYRMHSYRLLVSVYGKAPLRWGDALRETLESLEFGIKD